MKKTADELRNLVERLVPMLRDLVDDPDHATRPAPKKWSRKEILGHLIDSASNNQQKFVRMMQKPQLEFPGYRQDDWVDLQNYQQAEWTNMVELWRSYNLHIAYLIETCDPKYYSHTITIEGAGPFSLEFIMSDYVEHFKHHVKQIFPELDIKNAFRNVYGA